MVLEQEVLDAITQAVAAAQAANPNQNAATLAAAAATAAIAVKDEGTDGGVVAAVSHQIPDIWEEDVKGYFAIFEAACVKKKITQDETKYSHLLAALTPAVRKRMVGHLPEPGEEGALYETLKNKIKNTYTRTPAERAREVMDVFNLGDRDPLHLLSYMQGLLPDKKDQDNIFFRTIWLDAIPESIKDQLLGDDESEEGADLEALAKKATRILKGRKNRSSRVHTVRSLSPMPLEVSTPSGSDPLVNAVQQQSGAKSKVRGKKGYVCQNHMRYPGNAYRCAEPDKCLLRDVIVPAPSGNAGANRR